MADAICAFCKVANAVKVAMAIFCASLEDSLLLLLDCLRRIEDDDDVSRRRRRRRRRDSKVERHHIPMRGGDDSIPEDATSRNISRKRARK
jgi:hypothetical protein